MKINIKDKKLFDALNVCKNECSKHDDCGVRCPLFNDEETYECIFEISLEDSVFELDEDIQQQKCCESISDEFIIKLSWQDVINYIGKPIIICDIEHKCGMPIWQIIEGYYQKRDGDKIISTNERDVIFDNVKVYSINFDLINDKPIDKNE